MRYMESASLSTTISPTRLYFPPSLLSSSHLGSSRITPRGDDALGSSTAARTLTAPFLDVPRGLTTAPGRRWDRERADDPSRIANADPA
jgi:hypothetical protein